MSAPRVMVMGNLGYIGPAVVEAIRHDAPETAISGFDAGFFEMVTTQTVTLLSQRVDVQHYGDTRHIDASLFNDIDAVVYLAAVSNDPMGREFAEPTHAINSRAAVSVAQLAKSAGVTTFVFASSCSVYGAGGDLPKTEKDQTDPLTDYAKSKLDAEAALKEVASDDFIVTCLRFATACGPSPRMRLDLVLNDFVASAMTMREITILSDGSPLRPLIDVRDMGRAIAWAVGRRRETGAHLILNAGQNAWNFSVLDIANQVAEAFDGVALNVANNSGPDNRSYRVDFSLFENLAPHHSPTRALSDSIAAIAASLKQSEIPIADFRSGPLIRLNVLRRLIASQSIDQNLEWRRS